MKKKVFVLLLASILFINPPVKCYASAGTLVVQGGTIATGGLAVGALAGLAGPAVVITFAGLLAMGADIELTQQSQQAGMTKTQFVKNKIQSYCNEANITAGVFYKAILSGTNVVGDGTVKLSDSACSMMRKFVNWLENTGQISDGSGSQVSQGVNVSGHDFLYLNDIYYSNTFFYSSKDRRFLAGTYTTSTREQFKPTAFAFVKISNGTIYALCLSKDMFYHRLGITPGSTSSGSAQNLNGYYYSSTSVTGYADAGMITQPLIETTQISIDNFIRSLDGSFTFTTTNPEDTFTGTNVDTGALSPSGNTDAVINPGLTGSIPIPADTNVTVNVQDYLDALDKLLNGINDVTVGAIDQATGIPIEMDIPDTLVIDPTISREEDDPIHPQIETPVINDNDPADPEQTPSLVTEPLKFDLRNIFPFCIPFDIKDMLSLLSAEPVAPRYEVDWHIPLANVDLEFTIDLSVWNDVAIIVRKMELLAFIVGLAVETRNIIRG